MDVTETRYTLRRIASSRQDSAILAKALQIYHRDTPSIESAASSETVYWVDEYNKSFDDTLFVFAFSINDLLVGFGEFVFFKGPRFVILDYMTLDERYKTTGVFFQFYEQVRLFFEEIGLEYDFIVTEIVLDPKDGALTPSSELWRALMLLEGFRVLDAGYHQLQLGRSKFETNIPARLMVAMRSGGAAIRRETYLLIIRTLFFDHYVRWYTPFLSPSEFETYQAEATQKFEELSKKIQGKDTIGFAVVAEVPLPSGAMPNAYRENYRAILSEFITYLLLFVGLLISRAYFKLSTYDLISICLLALFIRILTLSIFVPQAKDALRSLSEFTTLFLTKKNNVARPRAGKPRQKRDSIEPRIGDE